ncbi:MAG TPA: S41 family peptidase [Candidatus Limnocylindrales bacterium]|nr:S41 family peptidase [Candidatus Limnocylindrales bacterium]
MDPQKWAFLFFFCLFFGFKTSSTYSQDQDIPFYLEAINQIQKNAFYLEPGTKPQDIVRETLKAYLKNLDRFSTYLSPEEYASFKASQKSRYVGIGMDIEVTSSDRILCIPHAHGPAEKAGIKFGDILESVNDISVSGKSLMDVSILVRGEAGKEVVLKVRRGDQLKTFRVKRKEIQARSVWITWQGTLPVITLSSFKSNTQRELKNLLLTLGEVSQMVLDLRGNPGGDLNEAVDSAMLFLDKNKKIVSIKTRAGVSIQYKSTSLPTNRTSQLFLWQDKRTASAAEVFIAALVQNDRARSIGEKTYGKGIMQDVIELKDGSALILTTALLQTPNGTLYHGKGLEPTDPLNIPSPETDHYLAKVRQLIEQENLSHPTSSIKTKSESIDTPSSMGNNFSEASVPSIPPKIEQEIPPVTYLVCLDKGYRIQEEAKNSVLEIRSSLNHFSDLYLLQRRTPEGIKFMACVGSFKSIQEAEHEQVRISKAMNLPVFIKEIRVEDSGGKVSKPTTYKRNGKISHPSDTSDLACYVDRSC